MRQLLFANLTTRTLSTTATGGSFTFPDLTAGERLGLSLRFSARVGGDTPVEIFPKIRSAKASIGFVDSRPTRGMFSLKLGTATSVVGVNVTAALPFNATAAQVKTALNALTSGPADFDVTADNNSWIVRRINGEELTLSVVNNTLYPTTFGRVFEQVVDGDRLYDVRLMQAPMASTSSFDRVLPQAPFITTVQDGGADPSNTFFYPEIQKLTIPPQFEGSYQLRLDDYYRTDILDTTDGAAAIRDAINAMLAQIGPDRSATVSNPTAGEALITFGGEAYLGENLEPLEVIVTSAPPGDVTVELDLDTAEVYTALRAAARLERVPLEIELEVLDENATGDNDQAASSRIVKLSTQVNIRRPVFFPGIETTQNVDWLRSPSPRDYVPFTASQIITGVQSYTATFGNGTDTTYSFPHNLGTAAMHLTVRQNGGSNLRIADNTYTAAFPSNNEAVLTFGTAVASNSLALTITTAGPASVFQSHTHTTAQIVGLDTLLESLGSRLNDVEQSLGIIGVGAAEATTLSSTLSLPPLADIFPPAKIRGEKEKQRVVLPPLPRAIYFGTAALSLGTATELPEANTAAGNVYQLTDAEVYMPARSPRRGRIITSADAPFVLSDGYEWYPAERKVTGSNVFYPVEMNRTLWELAVTPEMLAPGRKLKVNWSVLLAMQAERPELRGVYTLRVRKGTLAGETNFGTANNVEAVVWDTVGGLEQPLFEQRISLARSAVIHPFSLEIARSSAGVLSAKRTAYGKSASTPVPLNTQFILRAELSRFDLENYSNAMGRPVGQVYLQAGKAQGDIAKQIEEKFPLDSGSEVQSTEELLSMSATIV
jgi:hypothetical protein